MAGTLTTPPARSPRPWFRSGPLSTLRQEMESLFSGAWGDDEDIRWPGQLLPAADVSETDETIEVKMDIPGIQAADLDVQVNGNLLTISGERKEEKEEKGKTYHRIERRYGSFSRSTTLPAAVKEDKVEAQYHDGVLTITMEKTKDAKTRKIKVKT
jgi:HSP20 family protein